MHKFLHSFTQICVFSKSALHCFCFLAKSKVHTCIHVPAMNRNPLKLYAYSNSAHLWGAYPLHVCVSRSCIVIMGGPIESKYAYTKIRKHKRSRTSSGLVSLYSMNSTLRHDVLNSVRTTCIRIFPGEFISGAPPANQNGLIEFQKAEE